MVGPAGSINSSVNDMAKWLKLHLGGGKFDGRKLVGASTLADLHAPHMLIDAPPEREERHGHSRAARPPHPGPHPEARTYRLERRGPGHAREGEGS